MKAWLLRIAYYGLPVIVILASALAMHSGEALKRPAGPDDDVEGRLQEVQRLALAGRWDDAEAALVKLHGAWDQVRGRIRFTSETDELKIFDLELAELQGAVDARDPTRVRVANRKLLTLWNDLGN